MFDDGWTGDEPERNKPRFVCPHCGAFAAMEWSFLYVRNQRNNFETLSGWLSSACVSCGGVAVWLDEAMVYPGAPFGPPANADMPEAIKRLFEEARSVAALSPRSAAGLLRLALQTLVDELEKGSGSVHEKIGVLVSRGLSPVIQQAMDTVRVIGNNAVHPGEIALDDEPQQLSALFDLVNVIVDQMITRPRLVAEMYEKLPAGALAAIGRRDGDPSGS